MEDKMTAQSQMIDLPTGRFHYLSWNAERADLPGLLLLHGLTSSAWAWERVGEALAGSYRVYAPDLRGHGESVKSGAGTYGHSQLAEDMADFMEAVGLERPTLIGASWGGTIAVVLASGSGTRRPTPAFSHVILEDPALGMQQDSEEVTQARIESITQSTDELRTELATAHPYLTDDQIERRIAAFHNVIPEAIRSINDQWGEAGELVPLLAQISAPTLLMRADAMLGSTLDEVLWKQALEYLPAQGKAIEIKGANHNIHFSQFDAFMRHLYAFIEGLEEV
jgi:pimeloyl-ACP methyl ester carboxylesterase